MTLSSKRRTVLAITVALSACATAPTRTAPAPAAKQAAAKRAEAFDDGAPTWKPGPMARAALEALWAAPPFGLDASSLALASGGALARIHNGELLLFDSHLVLDAAGGGVETVRSVYRVLNDASDQTRVFTWSPWRQKRPIVRGRVVSPDGTERRVEFASIVEDSVSVSGIELSDVRQLSVVLPNARLGSVVELEIIREDTRPVLEGAGAMGNWDLWSFEPLRRIRLSVEAPVSVPLKVEVVGVDPPPVVRHGDAHRVTLDVEVPRFSPFAMTLPELREKAPRFTWSTAESWSKVAQRYRALVEPAFADRVDLSSLEPLVARATSREERIAAVQRWLSERVRYTAVTLGDGAVAPTLPSVVLSRGFGDCKDMAVLAAIALGRSGVPADVALVMAEGPPARDGTPGLGAFNHMIVHVPGREPDVKEVWLDATAPGYPVGSVPSAVREQRALIIAEGTSGLSPTPSRADSRFVVTQRFELTASSFGAGSGAATLDFAGAAEGSVRAAVAGCDEGVAHELAEPTVKKVMGDTPFHASLSGCRPGEGPITVTVQRHELAALDTGDQKIEVKFPSRIVDDVVPAWLPGLGPASDTRTEAQKKDQRQRTFDRTGHTEEELGRRAASFENRPTIERIYRLVLPPRFALAPLPASRTIEMGPSTWSESFTRVGEGTVEARFRFEVNRVDWSVDDVRAFRQALWKRFEEPVPVVTAFFAPLELLREKKPAQAMDLMKKWLLEKPTDGSTRARYARILVQLGLGDVARRETERASRDAPLDALVAMVCGDVARRDAYGVAYRPPFQRERAIACLRRARTIDPEHSWVTVALADTLRRNVNGEPESKWAGDVEEAARLLEAMVGRHEAPRTALEMLLEIYLEAGRVNDTQALLDAEPGLKDAQGPLKTLLEVLSQGTEGFLRRAEEIAEPRERLTALALGYGAFAHLRQYDEAASFLSQIPDDPVLGREIAAMKEMHQGLVRAPDAVDLSSAEAAARTVFAQLSNASSPSNGARRLAALASSTGRAELDGNPALFGLVRLPGLDRGVVFDQLYTRGTCSVEAKGAVIRVACELSEQIAIASVSFWVKEGGTLKLESLGTAVHLADRAWAAIEKGDVASSAAWIGWYIDELTARRVDNGAAKLLIDFWSQAEQSEPAKVRFAAAVARLVSSDMAESAPGAVVAALDAGRAGLSGSLRRGADATLVRTLDRRGRFALAARALEPLARSENQPWMWQYLATLEYKSAQYDAANQRLEAALKNDPKSPQWRELKAMAALHRGRYGEAVETLEALRRDRVQGVDVRNNLAWARLMAGRIDDELERDALGLIEGGEAGGEASEAALHTAAMVLLERGRVLDAAELGEKRLKHLKGKPDAGQWLLRGRLRQILGFSELAKAAYAKVSAKTDPELGVLVKRFLAEKRHGLEPESAVPEAPGELEAMTGRELRVAACRP